MQPFHEILGGLGVLAQPIITLRTVQPGSNRLKLSAAVERSAAIERLEL
jgi:hypothetical protein